MKKLSIGIMILLIIAMVWVSFHLKNKSNDHIVMVFGDSLTYGYGDKNGEGYVDGLEKALNHSDSKKRFRIWNYGIVGQETDGVLKQLDDIRIESRLDQADYFIVFIGTNDLINSNGGDLKQINDKKINQAKSEYERHLNEILTVLEKKNTKAPILVIGLYNPFKNEEQIEKHINDWNQLMIHAAMDDQRITYIPTNDLFKNIEKKKYFSDSLHPNEQGYTLITRRILERCSFTR
jgi:lysophospholipase L1-like esterase